MLNKGSLEYNRVDTLGETVTKFAMKVMTSKGLLPSLLGILLARAVVGDGLQPFAIPFFAAFAGTPIWLPAALALGHISAGSGASLLWLLLPMIPIYFIRIRAPTLSSTAVAIMAVAGQMLFRLPAVFGMLLPYDWLLYGLELLLVATAAVIFYQARDAIRHQPGWANEGFEQSLCIVVTCALALTSLSGLYWGPVAVLPLLCIWLVLLVGHASQQANAGAAAGLVAGLLVAFGQPAAAVIIAVFALGGLVSGLFSQWGKAGTVAGFAAGAVAMIIYAGQIPVGFGVIDFLAAGGLLALTPRALSRKVRRLVINNNGEWAWEYQQRLRRTTVARLQRLGQVFNRLSHAFGCHNGVGDVSANQNEMSKLIDHVAGEVCTSCANYSRCWEKELYSTYSQLLDYLVNAESWGEDTELDGLLARRCHNLEQLLGYARTCYDRYKNERNWSRKVQECKGVVSEQLHGVSEVIVNLSRQIRMDGNGRRDLEAELNDRLTRWGVEIFDLTITGIERNLPQVYLRAKIPGGENPLGLVQAMVSDVLGYALEPEQTKVTGDITEITYTLPIKFNADMGVAQSAREDVNGDSFTYLPGGSGKHVYMLSDGMGKGQVARKESNQALLLARDMLDAGFTAETAIKAINSLLVLRQSDDKFATMDMAVVDSTTGTLELYKTGSAPSFIKTGSEVEPISGSSLPIGIVPGIEPQTVSRNVTAGEYLVMVSDGMLDGGCRDETWLINQLQSFGNIGPKTMARQLLNRAAKIGEQLQDDATVVVVRLKEPMSENWTRQAG
ncbi:MAG: hypothetical protein FH749_08550 [Firmicutes bacterium]|nr:hypothetical protein [Bacillota bacterium]